MKSDTFFNSGLLSYVNFVESQINKMNVQDLKTVDIGKDCLMNCRSNIHKYGVKNKKKFKTKMHEGLLYVGRIK